MAGSSSARIPTAGPAGFLLPTSAHWHHHNLPFARKLPKPEAIQWHTVSESFSLLLSIRIVAPSLTILLRQKNECPEIIFQFKQIHLIKISCSELVSRCNVFKIVSFEKNQHSWDWWHLFLYCILCRDSLCRLNTSTSSITASIQAVYLKHLVMRGPVAWPLHTSFPLLEHSP